MSIANVAILFTDVVGSTELSQRVTAETADDVRRRHFAVLRQAIAATDGTEVKNLGDGVMVVFGSASAALECAVLMQQGTERENRGVDHRVGLRIGISGGEVTREADDYFGDPVVEAARLCAQCADGQILAAALLPAMAGRRNRQVCRAFGALELKGLPEPVETVEVVWEPLAPSGAAAIPFPGRLSVPLAFGFVGREAEFESIAQSAKRVANGEGREFVLLSGEAGQGKTTLAARAARAAFDDGASVLFGHCEEDLATPYRLFAEALGHFVTNATEAELAAHVEAYGSELVTLVPALGQRFPDLPASKASDPDTERYLLFAAAVGLIAAASAERPIVMVLDDLQWADKASLQLLRHLATTEQDMRLLVLATFRDNDLSQAHALRETLGGLRRTAGIGRVALGGLDDSCVVELIEGAAGASLDQTGVTLAHAVRRETDGNPFFVSELLRHLWETGAVSQRDDGSWAVEVSLEQMAMPDSVREVIGSRVVRLGADAERVLSMAAVIGRDFDLDVLAAVTQTTEDELLDILEAAATASLVREPADTSGTFSFAQALIQRTLYDDLGPNRRARAHRRIAQALEDLCGDRPDTRISELARHWTSATQPSDVDKAIHYSKLAGDVALASLAPADALRHYEHAIELSVHSRPSDDETVGLRDIDLAIGLGTAQRQTGESSFRATLLDAATQAAAYGDTERLVAAALANNRGWFSTVGDVDAEKIDVLELALARLGPDGADRALVLATLCSELTYGSTLERRQSLAAEAVSLAQAADDDAVLVRVLNLVILPLLVPQFLDQSLAWSAEAMARAERLQDPVLLFFAAHWRSIVALRAMDVDEANRCYERIEALARQIDQPMFHWTCTFDLALQALVAGDTQRAEHLASEAHRIGTECGQPDSTMFFGACLSVVCLQRGTLGDLIPMIEQMASGVSADTLASSLALAYAESGNLGAARQVLDRMAATGFDLPANAMWLTHMVNFAHAAIATGDAHAAALLFDHLSPFAGQLSHTGSLVEGPVSHALGGLATVLGRLAEADSYFAASAAFSARVGARFFAARTGLLWAAMLMERATPADTARARELLLDTRQLAADQGYANIERRAGELIEMLD